MLISEHPLTPGITECRLAAPRVNIIPRSFFRALVDPSAKAPRKNEGPGPHAPGPFGAQNGHSAKKSAEILTARGCLLRRVIALAKLLVEALSSKTPAL